MRKIENLAHLFTKKKQLKETVWAYAAKGLFLVSGAFFLYIIPNQLGVDQFGKFTLLQSYVSLLQLLFGTILFSGVRRELVEHKFDQLSVRYFSQLIKLCVILFVISSAVFILITSLISIPVLSEYKFYFLGLMAVTIFWDLMMLLFENAHRIIFITVMYFVEYGVKVALILGLVFLQQFSFSSLLITFIAGYLASAILGLIFAANQFKNWSVADLLRHDSVVIKKILNRTKYLGLSSISSLLLGRVDTVILSFLMPMDLVGYYSIAAEITRKATVVVQPIIMGVTPLIANAKDQVKLLTKTIQQLLGVNLLLMIGFLGLGKIFIELMYGVDYQLSITLLYLLSVTPLINTLKSFFGSLQVLKDDNRAVLIITVSRAILNPVINVILILAFGVYGAALTALIIGGTGVLASWWRVKKLYFRSSESLKSK